MKKLILLIIFLPFLQARAQTSIYHSFPDSNAVWNFHFDVTCPFGMSADYSIMIDGDTLFNNLNYKKLYTPVIQLAFGSSPCYFIESQYRGAIREDTLSKKVYIVPKYLSIEKLYFDFNWEVGDTITGHLQSSGFMPDTIILIDSILIGNSYRKRWHYNDCFPTSVIEGIGVVYGLIEIYSGCLTDQPIFNLTCFKQNNQPLYPDTATACDLITVSITETENEISEVIIYPNPVSDELNISFKIKKPADMELKLYSSLGQEVKIITKKLNVGENSLKISLEVLPKGVYFLKCNIEEAEVIKKLIKKN